MSESLVTVAVALFVTIDPIGVAPIFVALTRGFEPAHRRATAIRGTVIAAVILLAFALGGRTVMAAVGIGFPALRIAGGILLLLLAIDMVFARPSGIRGMTGPESAEAGQRDDISVFPLAIPLIAGPGAITTTLLVMSRAAGDPAAQAAVLGVLALVLGATLAILLGAAAVSRLLGVTGITVLNRVMGIVLAALACQFVLDGIGGSGLLH